MKLSDFLKALKCQDFSIGDSFWLNNIEFEVKNKKEPAHFLKITMTEIHCPYSGCPSNEGLRCKKEEITLGEDGQCMDRPEEGETNDQ
jgi:hypothetical protein